MRKLTIDGKETTILASPYSIVLYDRAFNRDLVEDSMELFKSFSNEKLNGITIMRILYTLEETAKLRQNPNAVFPNFEAWTLEKRNVHFDDTEMITALSNEVAEEFFQHAKENESSEE